MNRLIRRANMVLCGLLTIAATGVVLSHKVAMAGVTSCPAEEGALGNCNGTLTDQHNFNHCRSGGGPQNTHYCCQYENLVYKCDDQIIGYRSFLRSETLNGLCETSQDELLTHTKGVGIVCV